MQMVKYFIFFYLGLEIGFELEKERTETPPPLLFHRLTSYSGAPKYGNVFVGSAVIATPSETNLGNVPTPSTS